MARLLQHPRVEASVSHQCEYGLYTQAPNGERKLAKKPTMWVSSSPHMIDRLRRRCTGKHEHQHLDGGRPRGAAFYPPELVLEILRGIRDTDDALVASEEEISDVTASVTAAHSGFAEAGLSHDFERQFHDQDVAYSISATPGNFKFADGSTQKVDWKVKERYVDEYTGEDLPVPQVHEAVVDELQ